MPISEAQLSFLKTAIQALLDREEEARKLEVKLPWNGLFVGLLNTDLAFEQFDILDGFLRLRRVTNPPGIQHVISKAIRKSSDYLGVARYSWAIGSEIAINGAPEDNTSFFCSLAYHTAVLIKLRGPSTILCPTSSSVSWDTVASRPDDSISFVMLDDVPRLVQVSDQVRPVSLEDAEWIGNNFVAALDLRNHTRSRRFGLAFNLVYTCNHSADQRIALFNVWAGLEALFGIQNEQQPTKKLVARIVDWSSSLSRDMVHSLYSKRCDAVHGRWLDDKEISAALRDSYDVLRFALIQCIDRREQPLKDWSS